MEFISLLFWELNKFKLAFKISVDFWRFINIKSSWKIFCTLFFFFFLPGGRNSTFLSYSISNQANVHQSLKSSWLITDPAKDCIEITSLLPKRTLSVNSLDVLGPCLVCGTDEEAIYVTRQLFSWEYCNYKISGKNIQLTFQIETNMQIFIIRKCVIGRGSISKLLLMAMPSLDFVSWLFP